MREREECNVWKVAFAWHVRGSHREITIRGKKLLEEMKNEQDGVLLSLSL